MTPPCSPFWCSGLFALTVDGHGQLFRQLLLRGALCGRHACPWLATPLEDLGPPTGQGLHVAGPPEQMLDG